MSLALNDNLADGTVPLVNLVAFKLAKAEPSPSNAVADAVPVIDTPPDAVANFLDP